jgi:hypothetical protein
VIAALLLVLHTICWDPSAGATGYRLWWRSGTVCIPWGVEVWSLLCDGDIDCPTFTVGSRVCAESDIPVPAPARVTYFLVTAHNAAGQSGFRNAPGTAPGETPCP